MSQIRKNLSNAAQDISCGLGERNIWFALGWNDVKSRYNRSKLGVFWASLSMMIFVTALAQIYSNVMGVEIGEYTFHLLLGFVIWNFISSVILESGREFVGAANYLISFQLSYFTLLLRVVWRNLVVLGYQMIVFVLFAVFFKHSVNVSWLLAPLALVLIVLNALWMGLLMSVLATRYRDLSELVNNILRLAFFVTPIIWMPQVSERLIIVADLNPFFHMIEIFRAPLLSGDTVLCSWTAATAIPVAGWLIAFPLFAKYRSRIAFWI